MPPEASAAGGVDYWEAALRQLGEEGGAERAISGVIFHYPAHFFAFFEVTSRFLLATYKVGMLHPERPERDNFQLPSPHFVDAG